MSRRGRFELCTHATEDEKVVEWDVNENVEEDVEGTSVHAEW